jgi:hypothetical protein
MDRPAVGATRTVAVYERASQTMDRTAAIVDNDEVFLPAAFLVDPLGLKRKDLPAGRVGICRDDLCVSFSVGAGPNSLRRVGDREFVPVAFLAKALGGTMVWDAEGDDLLLDLTGRRPDLPVEPGPHLEFTLPDLDGKPVSLSAFRGRKVLLFAWASW